MGLKERRKKIMALMLAACVAGTSVVPVAASDVSVFSDGTDESNETANRTVKVKLVDEDTQKFIAGGDVLIGQTTTTMKANDLINGLACGLPEGYEVCAPGDVWVGDDSVTIEVRKLVTNRTVKVKLVDEDTQKFIAGGDVLIDQTTTTMNVNDLINGLACGLPEGYEVCAPGDVWVGDDSVTIEVRKIVKTKDITIVYQNRKGKIIDDKNIITVDKNAISVNTGDLTAPKGYTIAITGDITISKDNKVYITVDQNKKAVRIIFKEKESDKVIDSSKEISVVANAKSVKLSRITAPAGYQIVTTKPNLKISKKNTVTVKVKKLGRTIKVIYRDTTNEIVDTREIVVDKKATFISSNKIPVPAGYEMLTIGPCSVRTGIIDAYVVKR